MPDIIGIIVAWASEDWIGPAIEQARLQCDDLYVCISSHTKQLDRFADRTLDIANSYIGLKMIEHTESSYHAIEKATILNTVMSRVEVPAAKRFVSVEPMLEPVDLAKLPLVNGYGYEMLMNFMILIHIVRYEML